MSGRIGWWVSAVWLGAGLVGGACAQTVISINFTDNGDSGAQSGFLDPEEVAGAPGVRVANWNNIQTRDDAGNPLFDGVLGDNETVRFDDGSSVAGGLTITPSTINFSDRTNGSFTNDREMYNGVKDAFGGNFSVVVSNVPFAVFDVYCYMFDDGSGRIGTFTIGETTYYCRGGVGIPNSEGVGYVISVDTESDGATLAAHDQGNYVKFSGLSGDFTLVADAIGLEGNLPRNKFSGFQIVEPAAGTATNLTLESPVPDLLSGNPVGYQLSVSAELDSGESINITSEPETDYVSADPDVFTVTAIGRVDPGQAGTTDLIIGYQGLSITQSVTVLGPQSVTVGIETATLYVGAIGGADPPAQATLEAIFSGVGAVDVTGFDFVNFSGGPPAVVEVSADGLVAPVGPGAFDLTGTYAGVSDTLTGAGAVEVVDTPTLPGGRTALNLDFATANSLMTFRDLSGAPGARSANWNAVVVTGNSGSISDLADSTGLVRTGTTANLSVSVINGSTYVRTPPTPSTNESVMVSSIIDQINTPAGTTPDATLVVSGIPYASYDVYCYTWNDAGQPNRPAYFAVGGITNWIRNLNAGGIPSNDGSNYIEARTEGSPTTLAGVPQGNYVKFTGLRGSTLNMNFGAASTNRIADADSGAPRLKFSGLQIVEAVSGPSISAVEVQGADLVVRWASTVGAHYTVSTAGLLNPADWTVAATTLPATPPENAYTQTGFVVDQGFVRVEREVAPPLLDTDFESGAAGWTESGDSFGTQWQLGDPNGFGPGSAHSGSNCWGTNLSGNYTVLADVTLRSPLIDLTGISEATLSFRHYYDIEPSLGSDLFFDYAVLSVVDAGGNVLAVLMPNTAGHSTTWQPASFPLPPAALGQPVQLEFRLVSDDLAASYAGWYLDDVSITTP